MGEKRKEIQVFADWAGISEPVSMGVLYAAPVRGKEIFSFECSADWLKTQSARLLDPQLGHFHGIQYPQGDTANFGIFLDSAPDRWGRFLIRRREAIEARAENRLERHMCESDFLLGVFDGHRSGGLRYKMDTDGPWLNDDSRLASPPWTRLRELESASDYIENENFFENPEYAKWLNLLLAPGSSLGGARPKAGVMDTSGDLWIAKFPSRTDERDSGAWEMVVWELGKAAGLNLPEAKLLKLSGNQHTFLTRRFDRKKGKRIHFASALTMLGYNDGSDHSDGISYLEIVEFILRNGSLPEMDLSELWHRIVFNILVSNTDDHLRNHGFLLGPDGWHLSPAFDINPNPYGSGLTLNISESDNSMDPDLAVQVAPYFRINRDRAASKITDMKKVVGNWRQVAGRIGIPPPAQESMARAFT